MDRKYDDFNCPRCRKMTLHKLRRKFKAGRDGRGSVMLYEAKHCLVCNHYWGY